MGEVVGFWVVAFTELVPFSLHMLCEQQAVCRSSKVQRMTTTQQLALLSWCWEGMVVVARSVLAHIGLFLVLFLHVNRS